MKPLAKIVLGMLFGDEGKGITTDYLCSQSGDKGAIVVRFSGGQQAGHNVTIDGISHVHSNFGSGTLRGCPSYFTEHCTVYPTTIYREWSKLLELGLDPMLYIHPLAMVTTPYDVAYARVMDKKKGCGDSCGLGIGMTKIRNNTIGYKLYAIDLKHESILHAKMEQIGEYYASKLECEDKDAFYAIVTKEMRDFNNGVDSAPFRIEPYSFLTSINPCKAGSPRFGTIVFEGSQGILLDMDHGIFPFVTYSNTTSKNALEVCKNLGLTDIEIYYVARCYQTRHGNGWMSNDTPVELINTDSEINKHNEWQLGFKRSEIDYDLINYAVEVDQLYHQNMPIALKRMVITCLDQRPDLNVDKLKNNINCDGLTILGSYSPDSKDFAFI